MNYSTFTKSLVAAAAAASLLTGSIASAAPVSAKGVDPMVTLSVLGSSTSHAALCTAGGVTQPGCGVAAGNTAALAAVTTVQGDPYADSEPNLVPLFIVLAGMVAVFFLLDDVILGDDDEDDINFDVSPG
jgi:hypothetical protein